MFIASGYDLIREEGIEGGNLSKNAIPMLSNSMQRGRALRMPASSTSADIKGLSEFLGLDNPGNLLEVPIVTPEKDSAGGIILLSPYSNRLWSAEDQAFLTNIAASLVPIIQRGQKMSKLEQADEQARKTLEAAQNHIAELERQSAELKGQVDALKSQTESSQGENIASLLEVQEESQRTIEELQKELELARGKSGRSDSQLEQDLKATLQDVARLQNQLAESNIRVLELEKIGKAEHNKPSEQAEVIASISQELRQPMSSIVGYTDLLLGESVGILGALQRKFVERIKTSTERVGSLIDDMIQVTTLESGLADLKLEPVDLNKIIDNAMSYTGSQLREKNISLHLDLPKKLAPLIHLLQNAGAATPLEGAIQLKVQTVNDKGQDYIMIQFTDSGGGISAEDLPRVFTRMYRAENVLIQGIGDTGVGLSITKTLTEAQHGRIWVESEPGKGSTFSVLLPITGETSHPAPHPAPAKKEKK
jgi:signal transduction histidine kinase